MDRNTALNLAIEAGIEVSKAKKMATSQLITKLQKLQAERESVEASVTTSTVTEVTYVEPENAASFESSMDNFDWNDSAEKETYVLGWKVENAAGETKVFVLKYGCMEFEGKPYCQKYVTPEEMASKPEFFVRTYNKMKTAEQHRNDFLTLREKGAYHGLQVLTLKEVLAYA